MRSMANRDTNVPQPEVFVVREFEFESKSYGPDRPTGCYRIMCSRFQKGKPQPKQEAIDELQKGNPRFLGSGPNYSYCVSDPHKSLREVKQGEEKNRVQDREGWFCSDEPWKVIQGRIANIMKKYPCK